MPDWSRHFDDPILLPRGRKLFTLRDAAEYITKLPKAEHDTQEWQAAMEALLLVARVQPRPERPALGKAEAGKGSARCCALQRWNWKG